MRSSKSGSLTRTLPSYRRQGNLRRLLNHGLVIVVLGFVVVSAVQSLFLRSHHVVSNAMEPTLQAGEIVYVSPLLFGKSSPFSEGTWMDFSTAQRGGLVSVMAPYTLHLGFAQGLLDSLIRFFSLGRLHFVGAGEQPWERMEVIRRVVATEGDSVRYDGGQIYVQFGAKGQWQKVTYTKTGYSGFSPVAFVPAGLEEWKVPRASVFLLADHMDSSLDSRHWGPVGTSNLRGQILLRIWPLGKFGTLR